MSYFVIGDEDTVLGLRYAGVQGAIVDEPEKAREIFKRVCASKRYNLILLTERIAETIREDVNRVRFDVQEPLVVEIPGPEGPSPERPDLLKLIQEAVGIRL
jgi:V/A-type H+-transporting ATPase subunit F